MDQRIIKLYDRFTHGDINRREFLDRLAELAGSSAGAIALLPLLQNDYAKAETVAANDQRLTSETASYDAAETRMSGYLVRLKAKAKCPAVLVIHENRGLNAHIRDVVRRLALEGFLAFAVDGLSPYGGTPDDDDKARDMFAANIKPEETAPRMAAAVPFLARYAGSTGSVGLVGFCWGGGIANRVTVLSPGSRPPSSITDCRSRRRRCQRSVHRCCCIMPGLMSALMPGSRILKRRLRPMTSVTSSTSIRASITPSITIPAAGTTRLPPNSPGAVRSPF